MADLLGRAAELIGAERQDPALDLLVSNIGDLFANSIASERGRAAAIVTNGLSLAQAGRVTGIAPSTIAQARASLTQTPIEFDPKPNPNHATEEEREAFRSFVYLRSPVRSGTENERRLQSNTVRDFYDKEYVPYSSTSGFVQRSYNAILGWLSDLGVKKAKFDRYRCEICFEGRQAERRQKEGRTLQGDADLIEKYEIHISLVHHQHAACKVDKLINDPSTLLCIFDYTTIHDLTDEKWRDMGVFYKFQGKAGFVDNFADKAHDHHFTTSAWEATFEELEMQGIVLGGNIKRVVIWSDGGLKTKETLHYFQALTSKLKVTLSINYYAPYHGHSEADGHFGLGKQTMRNRAENGPITSVEEILKAFADLRQTAVQRIGVVENEIDVVPLDNLIRKWFEFEMEGGRCKCRERSHDGEFVENRIKTKEEKEAEKQAEKEQKEKEKEEKDDRGRRRRK